ncbi:hypothetical protein J6590_008638 [Homalodisca vitripennis]|nr:hypothetical protein J6590_008638 [Homalodisca vitripennis]
MEEKLPKTGDYALCSSCGNGLHLDTCSIKKKTWNNMSVSTQATWVCANCRKQKKGSTSQLDDEDNILTSNSDNTFESMKFIADKYDSLLAEVMGLRKENGELRARVEVLEKKEKSSKEVISNLSSDLGDLDQYGRRLNLEIHGLKVVGDPREENLSTVLEKLFNDIGMDYKPEDIHQAHHLQPRRDGKPLTIIVQYYSKKSRDLWLKNGRRVKISKIKFEVLVLAEVSCDEHELALFNIPGYTRGRGLAMFININTLNFSLITLDNISTYEHITVDLELIGSRDNYRVALHAVYRPPTSSTGFSLQLATQEFNMALTAIKIHKNVILIGDVNVNTTMTSNDLNTLEYEVVLADLGLDRGIWDYTKENIRVGSLVIADLGLDRGIRDYTREKIRVGSLVIADLGLDRGIWDYTKEKIRVGSLVIADLGLDRGIWDYTKEKIRTEAYGTIQKKIRVGSLVIADLGLDRGIWDYTREKNKGRKFIKVKISDHYPVVARIELSGRREGDTENEKIIRLNDRHEGWRKSNGQWMGIIL